MDPAIDPNCVFCAIANANAPAHRVLTSPTSTAFLDTRPLFFGHVLVVPRGHVVTLADLPKDELGPFFRDVQRVAVAVERGLGAGGSLVVVNNKVSQSVPHLHVHVVPRTKGDGLKGFFWPRKHYPSEAAMAEYAEKIAAAVDPP